MVIKKEITVTMSGIEIQRLSDMGELARVAIATNLTQSYTPDEVRAIKLFIDQVFEATR